ncbi:ribokinase [Rhodoferax sp.]|uniref:ribokinase n=1 Tax=Rhodoferax sp. TaxID=50421 RepID=UPI0025EB21BB|nr:ribokinase [Rhodoferax sp.]MCM2342871.1 ribokinase [Rhodoferax sp.]
MILVAGSANLDFVVRAAHIPAPGETVLGQGFTTYPGGKGANQAVACARAGGAATAMLLALGNDAHALPLLASLESVRVRLHTLRSPDQATGCAFICVADNAENAITVAPGANLCLQSQHLPELQDVSHLLMQLEIPITTVTAYAQRAQASGVQVVLNAAPAQGLPPELLQAVDLLVVNEGELRALVTHPGTVVAMLRQLEVPSVVVTLGQRGCIARQQDAYVLQPAFKIAPIDTTGAGDTFCGTLAAHLGRGETLAQAMRTASAAAALACTASGAQSSIPTAMEVEAFLGQQPVVDQSQIDALKSYCGLDAS